MDKSKELFRVLLITFIYWLIIAPVFVFFSELGGSKEVGNIVVLGLLFLIYLPFIFQFILAIISFYSKIDFILCYFSAFVQIAICFMAFVTVRSFGEMYFNYFLVINFILFTLNIISVKLFYKKFY